MSDCQGENYAFASLYGWLSPLYSIQVLATAPDAADWLDGAHLDNVVDGCAQLPS